MSDSDAADAGPGRRGRLAPARADASTVEQCGPGQARQFTSTGAGRRAHGRGSSVRVKIPYNTPPPTATSPAQGFSGAGRVRGGVREDRSIGTHGSSWVGAWEEGRRACGRKREARSVAASPCRRSPSRLSPPGWSSSERARNNAVWSAATVRFHAASAALIALGSTRVSPQKPNLGSQFAGSGAEGSKFPAGSSSCEDDVEGDAMVLQQSPFQLHL